MKYLATFEFEFEAESKEDAVELVSQIIELSKINEIDEEYLGRLVKFKKELVEVK